MTFLSRPMILNPHGLKEANHTVSGIIFSADQKILMMMDDRAPLWTLVGGNLDAHEDHRDEKNFLAALHREVGEEINTRIEILDFAGETWAPYPPADRPPYKYGYNHERVYLCNLPDDAPLPVLGNDGAGFGWFPIDDLPLNTVPRVRARIEAWMDSARTEPFSIVMPPETLGRKGFAPILYNYNMEDITGLDMWLESERVQAKIAQRKCFAPFNDFLIEKGPVLVRPGGALSKLKP